MRKSSESVVVAVVGLGIAALTLSLLLVNMARDHSEPSASAEISPRLAPVPNPAASSGQVADFDSEKQRKNTDRAPAGTSGVIPSPQSTLVPTPTQAPQPPDPPTPSPEPTSPPSSPPTSTPTAAPTSTPTPTATPPWPDQLASALPPLSQAIGEMPGPIWDASIPASAEYAAIVSGDALFILPTDGSDVSQLLSGSIHSIDTTDDAVAVLWLDSQPEATVLGLDGSPLWSVPRGTSFETVELVSAEGLAGGGLAKQVEIWSPEGALEPHVLNAKPSNDEPYLESDSHGPSGRLAFATSGEITAYVSQDATIELDSGDGPAAALAFDKSGTQLLVAYESGDVRVWYDGASGPSAASALSNVSAAAWLESHEAFVIGDSGGSLQLFTIFGGEILPVGPTFRLAERPVEILDIGTSADDELLVVDASGRFTRWTLPQSTLALLTSVASQAG